MKRALLVIGCVTRGCFLIAGCSGGAPAATTPVPAAAPPEPTAAPTATPTQPRTEPPPTATAEPACVPVLEERPCNPYAPAELLDELANSEDWQVRLFVARSPAAPARVLKRLEIGAVDDLRRAATTALGRDTR